MHEGLCRESAAPALYDISRADATRVGAARSRPARLAAHRPNPPPPTAEPLPAAAAPMDGENVTFSIGL